MLDSPVGLSVGKELPSNGEWAVPTVVQYELARWTARELAEADAAATIAFSSQLVVKPLDTDLATKAADLARRHRLAMADSIIYATAVDSGADLLTCDAHFVDLPGVLYLAKG